MPPTTEEWLDSLPNFAEVQGWGGLFQQRYWSKGKTYWFHTKDNGLTDRVTSSTLAELHQVFTQTKRGNNEDLEEEEDDTEESA